MGVSTNMIIYTLVILSLFFVDYILGNGFFEMSQKVFCKIACYIRKVVKEESKNSAIAGQDILTVNIPIMIIEFLLLSLTVKFLNNLKNSRNKNKIDELLQNSKDALQTANEFLEKWRLRRIKWETPVDYSYLDDEPQEIQPLELEVPLLHMAIVDSVCNTRTQLERGDAGDAVNFIDSTILSVSPLLDDDLESISEVQDDNNSVNQELKNFNDESRNFEFSNRYLWDVIEEDVDDRDVVDD